jgi:hypothetical protein
MCAYCFIDFKIWILATRQREKESRMKATLGKRKRMQEVTSHGT